MKYYSKNTLNSRSKKELIEYIECLQNNLQNEEKLNFHIYSTLCAVMKKDTAFAKAVGEVLETWNENSGHRYEERVKNDRA